MVWFAEPPTSLPEQSVVTVLIAQASDTTQIGSKTQVASQKKRILGVCEIVNGAGEVPEPKTEISPGTKAGGYMYDCEGKDLWFVTNPKTIIIESPKHGRLEQGYYYPDKGYYGNDSLIAQVEENGVSVEVRFFIHVLEEYVSSSDEPYKWFCNADIPPGGTNPWKISTAPTIVDTASLTDCAYSLSLPAKAFVGVGYPSPAITFTHLRAAGHGWYIDYTPYLNEEFLPTSN